MNICWFSESEIWNEPVLCYLETENPTSKYRRTGSRHTWSLNELTPPYMYIWHIQSYTCVCRSDVGSLLVSPRQSDTQIGAVLNFQPKYHTRVYAMDGMTSYTTEWFLKYYFQSIPILANWVYPKLQLGWLETSKSPNPPQPWSSSFWVLEVNNNCKLITMDSLEQPHKLIDSYKDSFDENCHKTK